MSLKNENAAGLNGIGRSAAGQGTAGQKTMRQGAAGSGTAKRNRTGSRQVEIDADHSLLTEILEMVNALMMLIGIYIFPAGLVSTETSAVVRFAAYGLLLIIPIAGSYLMIRKIRNLPLCILIALVCTVLLGTGAFFCGGAVRFGQYICPAITVILCAIIFATRFSAAVRQREMQNDFLATHEDEENIMMERWEMPTFLTEVARVQWVLVTVLYVVAAFTGRSAALKPLFAVFFAQILVWFVHEYMESFQTYIRSHNHVANMPLSMMKKVHNTIFIIAAVLVIAFMIPSLLYGKEPLDGLMNRLPQHESVQSTEQILPEEEQQTGGVSSPNMDEMLGVESKELPEWVKQLMNFVAYGICAGTAVWVLWHMIQRLREAGKEYSTDEKDEVIFLDDVADDTMEMLYGKNKREKGFFSPEAQIRRRYRKAIRKGTQGNPDSWASPAELENAASMEADTLLHRIYEKARYSKEGGKKEDLDRLTGSK